MIYKVSRQLTDPMGRIVNVANGAEASGITTDKIIPWTNQNWSMGAISFNLENTTLKFFGTNDDDSVADASADWDDILLIILGVAEETVSGEWIIDAPLPFARLKFEFTTTGATNSRSLRITRKR